MEIIVGESKKLVKTIISLIGLSFVGGSLIYLLFSFFTNWVFGGLWRMPAYHITHPYQYIFLMSVAYASTGIVWMKLFSGTKGFIRYFTLIVALFFTVLLASGPGGVLWVFHDMQAGYFPVGKRFWSDVFSGANSGLEAGWLIVLYSFPYNLVCLAFGVKLLDKYSRLLSLNRLGN